MNTFPLSASPTWVANRYAVRAILLTSFLTFGHSALGKDQPTYPPADGYAVSRTVKFDDLDLKLPGDAKKLYRRLKWSARVVCDARRAHSPEYIEAVVAPCVTTSLRNAVRAIDAPLLTAYLEKENQALASR